MEKITTARQESATGGNRGPKRKAAEESDDEVEPVPGGKHDRRDRSSKKPRVGVVGKTDRPKQGIPSEPGTGKGKKERGRERTAKRDQQRKERVAASGDAIAEGGSAPVPEKRGIEKQGAHLGSLIGRKRRQRKGGK